jgi:hypothetical protein
MITNTTNFDGVVCYKTYHLKHFDNIVFDMLNQFVLTFPSYDFDVGIFYSPIPTNQNLGVKPKVFLRFQLVESLSNFENCCHNQYPYFVIHFTTSFENQKAILQDIVADFDKWLFDSNQLLEFLYTKNTKNYKYKAWLGNNQNKKLDETYNTENIDNYNYHTYTIQIILNIYDSNI